MAVPHDDLPEDLERALLVGRVWQPAPVDGPCVVAVRGGRLYDLTAVTPTLADLLDRGDRVALARNAAGECLGPAADWLAGRAAGAMLAPCDLQPVKAAGATFAASLVERIGAEQAGGDAGRAAAVRERIAGLIGTDLSQLRPGSPEAARLKAVLWARGMWSPYLEVGLGPDAEVFSKAPPMASVGYGSWIGLLPESEWNNPEPEIVLAVDARGQAVGATLGNDVNLHDVEARSALLQNRAKDNNGSCAMGPFVRLFDASYGLGDVRRADVRLRIEGRRTVSCWTPRATCARSAATRSNWCARPAAAIISIRMGLCFSLAPCFRPPRTAPPPAAVSRTARATWYALPRRGWGRWSIA